MPLLLAVLSLLVVAAPAAAAGDWRRPVPGEVVRPFAYGGSPFRAGQHRGADFAAAPGARVASACTGRVVFAGTVPRHGRTVTVRCGRWRVTYAPVGRAAVRPGSVVMRGSEIGTAGAGHGGLHVGVRRAGDPFGYVDPLKRFGSGPSLPPAAVRFPRTGPRPARSRPPAFPPRAAPARPVAAPVPQVAPWPVWLGLALLLTGAAGGATLRWRPSARPARPSPGHARPSPRCLPAQTPRRRPPRLARRS